MTGRGIPVLVLAAAKDGGLNIARAIFNEEGEIWVDIPAVRLHPTADMWELVNHDPWPCGPNPDDGLCGACQHLDEQIGRLAGEVICHDDPDYRSRAFDAEGNPIWKGLP